MARPPEPYYGREIGTFTDFAHGVKVSWLLTTQLNLIHWILLPQGLVYAVDESTLFVKGFAYDGNAPDAYFWVGNTARPSPEGYIIPFPEEYTGRWE